jgi:hypothetical protein
MSIILLSFALGVACYSISQLQVHQKFKFENMKNPSGFWGGNQHRRKYKNGNTHLGLIKAPDNFYYKYIARVKYKEAWFTSTNFTIFLTDGYHSCQHISFVLFSLSLSLATGINFFIVWPGILLVHFTVYRILQK